MSTQSRGHGTQEGFPRSTLLLAHALAPAADPEPPTVDDVRLQAEAAFAEGVQLAAKKPGDARACFQCAASLFEKLARDGAANPELYRNIGNAWLLARDPDQPQSDELARAIFAYRRGLLLSPQDRQLQDNLAYARQLVVHPPGSAFGQPPVEHRPPWLPRWPGLLFGLMIACYVAGCLAVGRWWMVRRGPWPTLAAVGFALMALFLVGWGLEDWQLRQEAAEPLVVLAQDGVQLLSGNGPRFPARYETRLHPGVEARLRYDRGRWVQIELAGGEVGWVPRSAVLLAAP
ncbi:MAG: hypothetical protein JNM56_24170 [Planctomycetia bacterium]|nr:hypothetical protein [Planctomycetia bacterium]